MWCYCVCVLIDKWRASFVFNIAVDFKLNFLLNSVLFLKFTYFISSFIDYLPPNWAISMCKWLSWLFWKPKQHIKLKFSYADWMIQYKKKDVLYLCDCVCSPAHVHFTLAGWIMVQHIFQVDGKIGLLGEKKRS